MGMGDRIPPSSFGRRQDQPQVEQPKPQAAPAPAEPNTREIKVHADLILDVTDHVLSEVGSRIASMIAAATRQGFVAGAQAAMEDMATELGDDDGVQVARTAYSQGGAMYGPQTATNTGDQDEPVQLGEQRGSLGD